MSEWTGRKVVILGAARQGLALARYLAGSGVQVVLNDRRPAIEMQAARDSLAGLEVDWVFGGHPPSLLEGADLLCLSGGVPPTLPIVEEAARLGIPIANDSQLFLEEAPCPVVGITGSAGKTTTTTLFGRMAGKMAAGEQSFFKRVWVGGNIGSPLISVLDQMQPDDLAVMELSSFQLEIMTRSPQVAAVLNVTPNHLDRHANMLTYTAAKRRILDFQQPGNSAVLGREDGGSWSLAKWVRGRLLSFGIGQPEQDQPGTFLGGDTLYLWDGQSSLPLAPLSLVGLRGLHNLLNVLASCALGAAIGMPAWAMQAGIEGFRGVEHRLEFVRSWGGADWYNDSIATAPERTMAALQSFDEPLVLLVGGRDKNLPWDSLIEVLRQKVDHLILFGELAGKVANELEAHLGRRVPTSQPGQRPFSITRVSGLQEAVYTAAQVVEPGYVVLLSPGGTSFDEFRDFEGRGEAYRKWVMELL